jgi:hypothetical protein
MELCVDEHTKKPNTNFYMTTNGNSGPSKQIYLGGYENSVNTSTAFIKSKENVSDLNLRLRNSALILKKI